MIRNITIKEIDFNSNSYPSQLIDINSPPKKLYATSNIPELPMVSIVGTRRPTNYGIATTHKLAGDLARAGFCIVSGLAMGVDAIAHKAALEVGGSTLAVLGSGLNIPYPRSNSGLYKEIISSKNCCAISEYLPDATPYKSHFPARNRIIAGLSLVTIVTEADAKSGSLITANFALQNNRTVMAVPGNINASRSAGPNNLIKNGAHLITDTSDVLSYMGLKSPQLIHKSPKADSKEEQIILNLLSEGSLTTQQLIDATEIDAVSLSSIISLMEITGKIRNLGAGSWIST